MNNRKSDDNYEYLPSLIAKRFYPIADDIVKQCGDYDPDRFLVSECLCSTIYMSSPFGFKNFNPDIDKIFSLLPSDMRKLSSYIRKTAFSELQQYQILSGGDYKMDICSAKVNARYIVEINAASICWNENGKICYSIDPTFAEELLKTDKVEFDPKELLCLPYNYFYLDLESIPQFNLSGAFVCNYSGLKEVVIEIVPVINRRISSSTPVFLSKELLPVSLRYVCGNKYTENGKNRLNERFKTNKQIVIDYDGKQTLWVDCKADPKQFTQAKEDKTLSGFGFIHAW